MALEYSLKDVAESTKDKWRNESLPEAQRDRAWSTAQAIIFWHMALGMDSITRDNIAEWWTRYQILQPEGRLLKLSDVAEMIGLKTNVTYVKASPWMKRNYAVNLEEAQEQVKEYFDLQQSV